MSRHDWQCFFVQSRLQDLYATVLGGTGDRWRECERLDLLDIEDGEYRRLELPGWVGQRIHPTTPN
jgi:hypothetical protein